MFGADDGRDDGGKPPRLDRALVAALARQGVSCTRSQLARVFAAGKVTIGGAPVKPSRPVEIKNGEEICVELELLPPAPLRAEPEPLPLTVIYEDDHLLVVNKAAGMVVHPAPGHPGGTLVNAVLHHLRVLAEALPVMPGNEGLARPGIVHRLDKDTSGLLVIAKHLQAQEGLASQFRVHSIRRVYLGVVHGVPGWTSKTMHTLHGRDPRDRRRFVPVNPGPSTPSSEVKAAREAITHARLERPLGDDAALLSFRLETGRTHQIRMHARHVGHPIVGDAVYASRRARSPRVRAAARGLGRHALHATTLGFRHPVTGDEVDLHAPLPPELDGLVRRLEN